MHILSKVFIVFAAILSVLLSALTIAYAANSGRLVSEYQTSQARASSASTSLNLEQTQSAGREGVLRVQISELEGVIQGLNTQIASLQQERAGLESSLQAAQTSRDALEANIAQFRETIETQTNLIAAFRQELTTLRDNELAFRRARIQLEDRISDLESQNEVLTQTNRGLQEALSDAQTRSGSGGGSTFVPTTGRDISGRVNRVTNDSVTGRQLVEVSLGTNDGVRVGTRLTIQRPGVFVANAEVVRVELQTCVAEIRQMNNAGQPLLQNDTAVISR
ncbi:MAG: hypothetical protein R3B68_04580 [Phycisphaerales bacterium]